MKDKIVCALAAGFLALVVVSQPVSVWGAPVVVGVLGAVLFTACYAVWRLRRR